MLGNYEKYPYERFAFIRRFTHFEFLPRDPSSLIYISDINGQYNLWLQKAIILSNGDLYEPRQLTNFIDESVKAVFASPVDDNIVFLVDNKGSENYQMYGMNIFWGWPTPITNKSSVRYEYGQRCFSHNGNKIIYSSNEKKSSAMLIYMMDIRNRETFCLTDNYDGWFVPGFWSPDNTMINCSQLITLSNYALWVLDLDKGEMIKANPSGQEAKYIAGPWSSDCSGFYFISNLNREYKALAFYDLASSRIEWIYTCNWDVELMDMSKDGKTLAWIVNENGYSRMHIKNLRTNEYKKLNMPDGVIKQIKFSSHGKTIGFIMTTPKSPSNIFLIDIETEKIAKITNSLISTIPEEIMVSPEFVKYESFDNLEITALLYKPQNVTQGIKQKFPAILSIHGGPNNQERPEYAYEGLYQFLVSKGIAILAPNFRGSTGYGISFEKKIYHDWGGDELKDFEYAIKWLVSQEWIDSNRIAVYGISFGGFAALSCAARLSQYDWKAVVDVYGLSNLITTVSSAPLYWRPLLLEFIGDPEKEREFLKERSPINYIQNVNADLLIIQGANDPRAVRQESDQIVENLKNSGRSNNVRYLIFDDEGHGFSKYGNLLKARNATADFLLKKLL